MNSGVSPRKHQQLLDHSANVVRGHREAAEKGSWLGQPPYAYRIEGQKKSKRLAVDDPVKVRVVRRIFREFVDEGRSMLNIAKRLNDEGFPPPGNRGCPWRFDSVRTILQNPAYCGDYASQRFSYGKYNTVLKGKVNRGKRKSIKNDEAQWIITRDTHEAIVDRETFEKARAILAKGKTGRSTQYEHDENPFVFTGLLRCGKCGGPMWGDKNPRKGSSSTLAYRCGNWVYNGKEHCKGTKVYEPVVLQSLAGHLREWIGVDFLAGALTASREMFDESNLPPAFDDIKKLVCPPTLPKQDRTRLQRQVEKLKADAAKARGNLALLDAEFIPDVQKRIRDLDAEREAVERELEELKPVPEKDINAIAKEMFLNLIGLTQACYRLAGPEPEPRAPFQDPDPRVSALMDELGAVEPREEVVREVKRFLTHIGHIVIHSEAEGTGTGTRHRFVRGVLVLKVGGIKRESNLRFVVVIHAS